MKKTKAQRHERHALVQGLLKLEFNYCSICPNNEGTNNKLPEKVCGDCPKFKEITNIGKKLDELSENVRDAAIPEELTFKVYRYLREKLDWTKKRIRTHYKLSEADLNFFLKSHNDNDTAFEEPRKANNAGQFKIKMTVAEYHEMKRNDMTERKICAQLGVSGDTLVRWKKLNGIAIQIQPRKKIEMSETSVKS